MYYVIRMFAPSLHRKSTDFLIHINKHFRSDPMDNRWSSLLMRSERIFDSGREMWTVEMCLVNKSL